MLKLLHDEEIPKCFNVKASEIDMLVGLMAQITERKGESSAVTWLVERLWIDETFSDNLKAMALFMLGYSYCLQCIFGKEGGEEKWKK